jgi:hypothetical protein
MHDIDRTLREQEFGHELEFSQEFEDEFNQEYNLETSEAFGQELLQEMIQGNNPDMEYEEEGAMNENMEMELINELLTVSNEQELNQFVGGLIKRAAGAASNFAQSAAGRKVGNFLVNFGQRTLPALAARAGGLAGGALANQYAKHTGDFINSAHFKTVGSPIGQQLGTKAGNLIASTAKKVFNLEFEGLNPEDREYEIARSYVQFASEVARRAGATVRRNPSIGLSDLSRQVLPQAAQRYAPGLLTNSVAGRRRKGTWIRRGKTIIIYEYQ